MIMKVNYFFPFVWVSIQHLFHWEIPLNIKDIIIQVEMLKKVFLHNLCKLIIIFHKYLTQFFYYFLFQMKGWNY